MKIFLLSVLLFLSCKGSVDDHPPCFPDKGIKEATSTARLVNGGDDPVSQTMRYDVQGRPITRKQADSRVVKFEYDSGGLRRTIVSNFAEGVDQFPSMAKIESVDTNTVTKNDEFGRALEFRGGDGELAVFSYDGCKIEIQKYYDTTGDTYQQNRIEYKNGVVVKTIWTIGEESQGRETRYYNYKYDGVGNWVARMYEHASGEQVQESRVITYF